MLKLSNIPGLSEALLPIDAIDAASAYALIMVLFLISLAVSTTYFALSASYYAT